eukprot:11917166-Prorocentrum_lima.AAC.1
MTFQETSKDTGENLRTVQFDSPSEDAWILQKLLGMVDYGTSIQILGLMMAMWGLMDAPGAFGMRLN